MLAETGLFVALEGGDGAGKSTQARLLARRLESTSYDVLLTREPGATDVGAEIRRLVLAPETGTIHPRTEALLYAADKSEHVETVLRPALARGAVVVTDRYVDSSLAYQGGGRTSHDGLEAMLRWATGDLRPHLTVLLDVAPAEARSAGQDRIEAEGADFHTRVRDHFLALAAADPEHYLVLDARGDREAIAAQVWARVEELLR
ncbi:hypothetical protein GCM10011519_24510 [Marmoricola endophyticus]|uniref:Thymidylate kinase n=1 Tax=Marmoricola endophyticus TaxID=2040280 RepID=A0A917F4H8_9ACTN|nr:dTMP kinase [Marmoricola endophyticus]GGF49665.1 hypothetical protein GCM10011519_24510 [Marmoricola endophyticus]